MMDKKKTTTKTAKTKTTKAPRTRQTYMTSHWAIFGIRGLVALGFGWFIIFNDVADASTLVVLVGLALASLGAVELFNALYRDRHRLSWVQPVALAGLEIAVAVALLATRNVPVAVHLSIVAAYTTVRGLFDLWIGLRILTDATDRFLWAATGVFGAILGFVIFNSGNIDLANTTFVKIFGTYLMASGLASLVYAIHSKNVPAAARKRN